MLRLSSQNKGANMWLMICSAQDESALWAYYGLRARGLNPLELVTAEMLTTSARWEHTVGVDGANFTVTLADGRVINNRRINGVVNRLTHVPLHHLAGHSAAHAGILRRRNGLPRGPRVCRRGRSGRTERRDSVAR